jgi:hypothetical protein
MLRLATVPLTFLLAWGTVAVGDSSVGEVAPRDVRLTDNQAATVGDAASELLGPAAKVSWRVWDPAAAKDGYDHRLRSAQRIYTGTITRPENSHLIRMEEVVRQVEETLRSAGKLSEAEREALRRVLGDAGQVLFYTESRGSQPAKLRPAVTRRLEREALELAEAEQLFAQFIRLAHVHRMLAGPPQTSRKRSALEAEYAQLAAQLYER